MSNIGHQFNAESANFIGHSGYFTDDYGRAIAHSITSAVAAEIGGGSGKGAAAGAFAAELAAISLGDTFISNSSSYNDYYQKMLNLGKLTGAVAGAIIAQSSEGVYSGSNAGYLVIENNYMAQQIIDEHKQELRDTTLLFDGDEEKAQIYINAKNKAQGIGAADGVVETIEGTTNVILHPVDTAVGLYEVVTNPDKVYEAIKVSVTEWTELYDYALKNDPALAGEMAGYLEGKIGGEAVSGYVIGAGAAKVVQKVVALKTIVKIDVITKPVTKAETGIKWGEGIKGQGMPWEDFVGTELPAGSRLPTNFKTFDYYDLNTGKAISVKTLDTTTAAKLANPNQIYSTLKDNIDAAAGFEKYTLNRVTISSTDIISKEIRLAIPAATNQAQWEQIYKAIDYGKSQGVKVIVTEVK